MKMADKTAAGSACASSPSDFPPARPSSSPTRATNGYLIYSAAKNKYGERSQSLGKRLGRLKADLASMIDMYSYVDNKSIREPRPSQSGENSPKPALIARTALIS